MVDILSRSTHFRIEDLSIGSGALTHMLISEGNRISPMMIVDNFRGGLGLNVGQSSNGGGCPFVVGTSMESECFVSSGTGYVARRATSTTLVNQRNNQFLYTSSDGSLFYIDGNYIAGGSNGSGGILWRIVRPNGSVINITWDIYTQQTSYGAVSSLGMLSVSTNAGFALKYEYASDDRANSDLLGGWFTLRKITAFNKSVENCADSTLHCSFANSWPSTMLTWTTTNPNIGYTLQLANAVGETITYRTDPIFRVVGYKPATARVEQYTWTYCQALQASQAPAEYRLYYGEPCSIASQGGTRVINDGVKWAIREGRQWNYRPQLTIGGCGCYYYNTSTDPDGKTMTVSAFTNAAEPEVLVFNDNRHGKSYNFAQNDTNALLSEAVSGEAGWGYTYDGRGNVVESRRIALSGSGDTDIVVTATYPAACSNAVTCNKPLTVTDANGNAMSSDYNPVHGMPTVINWPAVAGVVKQKRIGYVQRAAVFFQGNGALTASSDSIWLPARESECLTSEWTGSGCSAGGGDEVVTEYDYGPPSVPGNLLLRGVMVTASGQSRRTCFTYDKVGNKIAETKPNAGLSSCS